MNLKWNWMVVGVVAALNFAQANDGDAVVVRMAKAKVDVRKVWYEHGADGVMRGREERVCLKEVDVRVQKMEGPDHYVIRPTEVECETLVDGIAAKVSIQAMMVMGVMELPDPYEPQDPKNFGISLALHQGSKVKTDMSWARSEASTRYLSLALQTAHLIADSSKIPKGGRTDDIVIATIFFVDSEI